MTEIEAKRKELEKKLNQTKEKYFNEKNIRIMRIIEKEENLLQTALDNFNLGVSMARKEFLDYLEGLSTASIDWDDCGRDIERKIKELKQSLEEKGE